jgi:hypothetical protein
MQTQDTANAAHGRVNAPTYIVEAVVAGLLLGLGLIVIYGSSKLGSGWTSDGPAAGYFPFYIGLLLCIASAGTLVQTLFGKKRNTEGFVDREQFRRVLIVALPAAVYVLAIGFVGIYIASAVYIAAFMIVLGHFGAAKSIAAAVVINVLFFCMFEIWFQVPLVKGSLDPLSFLGY